eukprot:CAMPEP_0119128158 /NCGR_PEP_ID=MMETSP1310-20130426/6419_1 /TAXON_ID=464262 /ORGANISM="Genus nov. species nov., Strain RCC2339" /LENGTH=891 /DNA_ID=CAMNT_0007118469 /DNA_START=127 /DNA_END=2798 /DNA_ORIENTATION=+
MEGESRRGPPPPLPRDDEQSTEEEGRGATGREVRRGRPPPLPPGRGGRRQSLSVAEARPPTPIVERTSRGEVQRPRPRRTSVHGRGTRSDVEAVPGGGAPALQVVPPTLLTSAPSGRPLPSLPPALRPGGYKYGGELMPCACCRLPEAPDVVKCKLCDKNSCGMCLNRRRCHTCSGRPACPLRVPHGAGATPGPASKPQQKKKERRPVVEEFLATEERYLEVLASWLAAYQAPLDDVLTVRKDRLIFGMIPALAGLHKDLRDGLEALLQTWGKETCVGPLLLEWIPRLEVYSEYARNVGRATACLHLLYHKNGDFKDIVEQCSTGKVYKGYRGLCSLLVTPLQRAMRYVILTKALLKETPAEHPDHDPLAHALEDAGFAVDRINEEKRVADKEAEVEELEANLKGNFEFLRSSRLTDSAVEEHSFAPRPDLSLVPCDACGHVILKDVLSCDQCNLHIHTECSAAEGIPPCGHFYRPRLVTEDRTFVAAHAEVTLTQIRTGADFGDQVKKNRGKQCTAFIFSDCVLFVTREDGAEFRVYDVLKFYSFGRDAWASATNVEGTDEAGNRQFLVQIGPSTGDVVRTVRFKSVEQGQSFFGDITSSLGRYKEEVLASEPAGVQVASSPTNPPPAVEKQKSKNVTRKYIFSVLNTVPVASGQGKGDVYTAYVVNVTPGRGEPGFEILKRFRQFHSLDAHLRKEYGDNIVKSIARMPSKKWFNPTDPTVVQKRCRKLEKYLNDLNNLVGVWTLPIVQRFLRTGVEDEEDEEDEDYDGGANLGVGSRRSGRLSRYLSALTPARAGSLSESGSPARAQSGYKAAPAEGRLLAPSNPLSRSRDGYAPPPPVMGDSGSRVRAIYDFGTNGDNQLAFKAGEILNVTVKDNNEWWFARNSSGKT